MLHLSFWSFLQNILILIGCGEVRGQLAEVCSLLPGGPEGQTQAVGPGGKHLNLATLISPSGLFCGVFVVLYY